MLIVYIPLTGTFTGSAYSRCTDLNKRAKLLSSDVIVQKKTRFWLIAELIRSKYGLQETPMISRVNTYMR